MTRKLLVSRYNEDLDWLEGINIPTIVYNKGTALGEELIQKIKKNKPYFELKTVPNVGREAYSYLHHFYNNYDNLDDITIHLQGNPFDHICNYNRIIGDSNFFFSTKTDYNKISLEHSDKIDKFVTFVNKFDKNCFFGFGIFHGDWGFLEEIRRFMSKLEIPIVRSDFGHTTKYTTGAQFCIPRHIVQRNKKEIYGRVLNCLETPDFEGVVCSVNIANVLERCLFDFFQIDYYNPGVDICNTI